MSVEDKLNVKLNQNLWALIVSLTGLGASEYYHLNKLYWFSNILSYACAISFGFSLLFYTIKYCVDKWESIVRSNKK